MARGLVVLAVVASVLATATPASAFKPYTHVATGKAVLDDVLDDGAVTIAGRSYPIPEHVRKALTDYPTYFNAGVIGPDGFPDLTFGQSVIHSSETGAWIRHLLDRSAIVTDGGHVPEARYQNLAWTYGFMFHTIGDLWAHTFVNEVSEGVFPGVGEIVDDLGQLELEKVSIALRHTIIEGYIGDATPGYDGDPAPSRLDNGDISSIATPGIDFDAPVNFIYHSLVNPRRPLPVGTCGDHIDDDGDGAVDDGCWGQANYTVGDPEPSRGPGIDFFLDLQSDLEMARAEYTADEAHTDCTLFDPDCSEFDKTVWASTVRGLRSSTITLRGCDPDALIGCLASGTDVADDLILNDMFIAYLDAWIEDIETGLKHWPELGLQITRALFDADTKRDIQNHLCRNEGSEEGELRRECEDKLGAVDYVTEETSQFQTDYLYSMLGAPDFVGSFAESLSDFSGWLDDAIGTTFNPLSLAQHQINEFAKEMIFGMIEERYGVDIEEIKEVLGKPTKILVEGGIDLDKPDVYLPLFDDGTHERVDEILGLVGDHHESEAEGYRLGDDVEFDPATMPLFQNTVTLAKLALLDGPTLDQVLSDLTGGDVNYYSQFPNANIMTVGAGSHLSGEAPPLIYGDAPPVSLGPDSVRIDGRPAGEGKRADWLGPLDSAGDVNGDGITDLIVGAPNARDPESPEDARVPEAAYVLFGPFVGDASVQNLNEPGGPRGFMITGSNLADFRPSPNIYRIGTEVEGIGDFNGDGLDDLMVKAQTRSFIVFGKAGTETVDLNTLFDPTFTGSPVGIHVNLSLSNSWGYLTDLFSGVGDVNGDGLADVAVWTAKGEGRALAVIYGTEDAAPIVLEDFVAQDAEGTYLGTEFGMVIPAYAVSSPVGLGDMNADGFDDLAFTLERPDHVEGPRAGVYVIYGAADPGGRVVPLDCISSVCTGADGKDRINHTGWYVDQGGRSPFSTTWFNEDLNEPDPFAVNFARQNDDEYRYTWGSNYVGINPFASGINFGQDLAGVGDVTGDGVPDLAIVAEAEEGSTAEDDYHPNSGVVLVVAGGDHTGVVTPAEATTMRVRGPEGIGLDAEIHTVDAAGDVDGDGINDLAITSYDPALRQQDGGDAQSVTSRYVSVVFGKDVEAISGGDDDVRSSLDVDIDDIITDPSAEGYVMSGPGLQGDIPSRGDRLDSRVPAMVTAVGDLDGDGRDDLVVSNGAADSPAGADAGAVFVPTSAGRPLIPDPEFEAEPVLVPWLTSIDSDHAWRADGLPIFDREGGGNGNFPLWESCVLRDKVFRELFVDWESEDGNFPAFGDDSDLLLDGLTTSEECGLDGDAIESEIDGYMDGGAFVDESEVTSSRFSDGSGTNGNIVDDGGLVVRAERHADGVALSTSGSGGSATLELCQDPTWGLVLQAGDAGVATCGSLTWQATAGDVSITIADLSVSVPTGAVVTLRQTDDGLSVEVPPESDASVVLTEPDGTEIVVDPGSSNLDPGGGQATDPDDGPAVDPGLDLGDDESSIPSLIEVCEQGGDAFADDDGSVHEAAIDCLAALGLLEGFPDGTVVPTLDVTRGQAAGMVMRLLVAYSGDDIDVLCPDGGEPFSDGGPTFGAAIACLHALDVLSGYPDGTYRPDENISRSQAASLVVGVAPLLGIELPDAVPAGFGDVEPQGVHRGAIGRLAAAGVLEGFDADTFGPWRNLTRGQLASVLTRLLRWGE